MASETRPRVLILGGGFGGLYAAKVLANKDVDVTLVDRRNFHLFQPLLYQVATGTLSPGDVAFPLRSALRKARNVRVLLGEAVNLGDGLVALADGTQLPYDYLIVALGSTRSYFNHPEWEEVAPPLKSLEDALEMRRTIFCAFERAELEADPEKRKELLTFSIIGGGSTGVELAGTLAEISRETLREDFRSFDPRTTRIVLIEMAERILPAYPEKLSEAARRSLEGLGVEVLTGTSVTAIEDDRLVVQKPTCVEIIPSSTTLWAAGVGSSPFALVLQQKLGCELNRGRVVVDADLSVPGHPNVFVVGDLSAHPDKLPGVAQVAIQGGQHAARCILRGGRTAFRYRDKGNLSVIGRNRAVAEIGRFKFSGFFAWIVWAVVHIAYLIGFQSKFLVMFQWAWNYLFFNRSARLITNTPEG